MPYARQRRRRAREHRHGPAARSFLNGSTGAAPSRTEAVLDAIKHAILAGELRPGQGLVETELAQMLGVSKTPVREALKTLAGAGLVTMSPYRGATVRAIDPASAAAIYDLRLLLEPEGVRRAVQAGADQAGPGGPAGPGRRSLGGRPGRPGRLGRRRRPGPAQPGQPGVPPCPVPGLRQPPAGEDPRRPARPDRAGVRAVLGAGRVMAAGGGRAPGHPGRGPQRRGRRGGGPAARAHRRFRGPAFP